MARIPKRISFFWSGRMSWMRWLTLDTFIRLNPGWEVHLYTPPENTVLSKHWTGKADDDNSYRGLDYWDRLHSSIQVHVFNPPTRMAAAQMCDFFQWELLSTIGGLYADLDILWISPLDDAIADYLSADILLCLESGILAIGFVGSSANCPFFKRVSKMAQAFMRKRKQNTNYQHYGASLLYSLFTRGKRQMNVASVLRHIELEHSNSRLAVLPSKLIYPFDWRQTREIFEESRPTPNCSLGLHWFGGCPISNRWNDTLTEANWKDHKNTFTNCLSGLEKTNGKNNAAVSATADPS